MLLAQWCRDLHMVSGNNNAVNADVDVATDKRVHAREAVRATLTLQ